MSKCIMYSAIQTLFGLTCDKSYTSNKGKYAHKSNYHHQLGFT